MVDARGGRLSRFARFALVVLDAAAHRLAGRDSRIEGAHLLVHDERGRILAVRVAYLTGEWTLPGGSVQRDETPHHAAERETLEETGIVAVATRALLVDARRRRSVSFVFAGEPRGGTLLPQPGEIAAVEWVSRDAIRATSPHLERLLGWLDAAVDGPLYLGINPPG